MSEAAPVSRAPTDTLLVELVTEELPPKALKTLGEAFATALTTELAQSNVLTDESAVTSYATPRRLAVTIAGVRSIAPDSEVVQKLMPRSVAEDANGKPTAALERRLGKIGRAHLARGYPDAWDGPDHLYVGSDGKADQVWLRQLAAGQPLARALQDALETAIARLPIPKVMRYPAPGSYYNDVEFVRPAHRLVALHGADVVPVHALGLDAGRVSAGHRFLARGDLTIRAAEAYVPTLEAEGKVQPSFAVRRAAIEDALLSVAAGARVIAPDALLDEVTALVETHRKHCRSVCWLHSVECRRVVNARSPTV